MLGRRVAAKQDQTWSMRTPNNIIFTSAHAIFNKTLFPKCPLAVRRPNTRVQTPAPEPSRAPCPEEPSTCGKGKHCHCPPKVDECQEHGIFQTFSLSLSRLLFVLSLHILSFQFHSSRKNKMRAIDPITSRAQRTTTMDNPFQSAI